MLPRFVKALDCHRKGIMRLALVSLLLALSANSQPAAAQGYARAYSNLSKDVNVVEAIGTNVDSNTQSDQDIPTITQSRTNVGTFVYDRTFAEPYFGNTGGIGFIVPYPIN